MSQALLELHLASFRSNFYPSTIIASQLHQQKLYSISSPNNNGLTFLSSLTYLLQQLLQYPFKLTFGKLDTFSSSSRLHLYLSHIPSSSSLSKSAPAFLNLSRLQKQSHTFLQFTTFLFMLFARPQATLRMASSKVTCHGAGLVAGDADRKNSFTVFVDKGKVSGISVAFEGKIRIVFPSYKSGSSSKNKKTR